MPVRTRLGKDSWWEKGVGILLFTSEWPQDFSSTDPPSRKDTQKMSQSNVPSPGNQMFQAKPVSLPLSLCACNPTGMALGHSQLGDGVPLQEDDCVRMVGDHLSLRQGLAEST